MYNTGIIKSMKITVNGNLKEINEIKTISELLELLSINENNIVVEHNGNIITKSEYAEITIKEDDKLELVRFVGGG